MCFQRWARIFIPTPGSRFLSNVGPAFVFPASGMATLVFPSLGRPIVGKKMLGECFKQNLGPVAENKMGGFKHMVPTSADTFYIQQLIKPLTSPGLPIA